MKVLICVFVLLFGLNHSEPAKSPRDHVDNVNLNQKTLPESTFASIESNNSGIKGHVEVLRTPYKLENDKNLYRVIRLSNGLKVLLISTRENELADGKGRNKAMEHLKTHPKKAACNLNVDVGSFSDPRDAQGLAHLVEHVIFRGSEKYPGDNEVFQFIRKTGGEYYAETGVDCTSYSFETHEEHLDGALDRFSYLFKAPLMRKESLLREREAVFSEYDSSKNDDALRFARMLSSLGEKTYPSSVIRCGNSKTLKENIDDDELHRKVQEFQKRHYSAHRMNLCLQSSRSLDNLQEMVVRHFSAIANNHMPGDDFSAFTHFNAFQPKFHEKVYYVKPIKIGSIIVITWCLEPMAKNFDKKTEYILSYLFLREGKGSLISYLRKKLWATELLTLDDELGHKANMRPNKIFTIFDLHIRLTEKGFDHLDDVIGAVFSYMKFLQHVNLNESTFNELRTAFANVNRFSRGLSAWDNVKYLGKNMLLYPTKFIVSAPQYLFDYDADAIKKTIDYMNQRTFNIMVALKRSRSKQLFYSSTEPRFGIKYTEMDMPAKWIELHQKAEPFAQFTLPETNPFIANNFTILYKGGDGNSSPKKIFENKFSNLWIWKKSENLRPHAVFTFTFVKPSAATSIDNQIHMTLLATWLNHQLVEKLYPATLAGIKYTCEKAGTGIFFEIQGFNQKMYLVADIFAKTLKTVARGPTGDELRVFVQQQFETYEQGLLDPSFVNSELRSSVEHSHYQTLWEEYKRLRSISFLDFQQFCRDFCPQVFAVAYVHGNIEEDQAINIMRTFVNNFQCKRKYNETVFYDTPKKLPIGAHYLRVRNFNAKDVNSVITNVYQIGPATLSIRSLLNLLEIIAQEPVFNILRYKDLLAHKFEFGLQYTFGVQGYSITIHSQETKFTTDYVDERIENFRRELLTIIERMSLNDFETFKKSLAKNKWIAHDMSIEIMDWNSNSDKGEFDYVRSEVEYLLKITKAKFLEFCRTHLSATNQRKLSIQVIGNAHADDGGSDSNDVVGSFDRLTYVNFTGKPKGILIKDLRKFRNRLEDWK